jgi:integrase
METRKMDLPKAQFHSTDRRGVVYLIAGNKKRHYFIRYRSPDGQQHFERAVIPGVTTMTAAKADQLRQDKARGKVVPNRERRKREREAKVAEAGKWTFDKLWAAWQSDPENKGKRGTIKADQRYRKHLKVPFGNREPSSLKPLDIDRLRLFLATGHAKATTITILGLIRRIERYGASKELCAGLSFPIILKGKKLGKDPRVKKAPSDDQVESYIKTCEEWPDVQAGNFQLFIAYTGARRGSARNLKWEDIDLGNATAVLKDSKTGDVQIVLSDDAVKLLRSHPETEDVEYVFSGKGPDGMRSQREIDRIPAKIRKAAGIPADLDPCHMFRRRMATKVEARFGIAAAMGAGGWKSPAMVINYTATTRQTLRDAANLLGRKVPAGGGR